MEAFSSFSGYEHGPDKPKISSRIHYHTVAIIQPLVSGNSRLVSASPRPLVGGTGGSRGAQLWCEIAPP